MILIFFFAKSVNII